LLERDCNADLVAGGFKRTYRVLGYSIKGSFKLDDFIVYPYPYISNVTESINEIIPTELNQNYPNPFNPSTELRYVLHSSSRVWLRVYDVLGKLVKTLVENEPQSAGEYFIRWGGMDNQRKDVCSGVYFEVLETRSVTGKKASLTTRKMMMLR